jgi:hypothetical protein
MKRNSFRYYLDGEFIKRPEPIFALWITDVNGYSDVSGETLLKQGKPIPLFPDYQTWRREVSTKRRCGRCWRVVRGTVDLARHCELIHKTKLLHMPDGYSFGDPLWRDENLAQRAQKVLLIVLVLFAGSFLTGCRGLDRLMNGSSSYEAAPSDQRVTIVADPNHQPTRIVPRGAL